jgi:thiamine biosynthesis lipoprotein ApbE
MEAARASIRRARPLLGTFVEIAVAGTAISAMEAAVEAAFAAVATVHRLMSFHEATSDVSRLNRDAWSGAIPVHGWTYRVLETALDLNRRSSGMFDIAVAPVLQEMGLLQRGPDLSSASPSPRLPSGRLRSSPSKTGVNALSSATGYGEGRGEGAFPQLQIRGEAPSPGAQARADLSPQAGRGEGCGLFRLPGGAYDAIQLLPENQVRFAHRGVSIDLGGIAKGFAVDLAIETLCRHGIPDGLVNAGGDLAAFGPRRHSVDIRDPRHPDRPMCHIVLSNAALASSAGHYDPSRSDLPSSSAIVDPLTGRPSHVIRGATVSAPSCIIADALTKVVMNVGEDAAALLEHYGASALFVSAQGGVHVTTDWKNEVRFAA